MGVDATFVRYGSSWHFKLMGQLPIKGELLIDPVDSKVAIKYDPPKHSVQLMTSFFRPLTCFVVTPNFVLDPHTMFYELVNVYGRENVHDVYVEVSELFDITCNWNA